MARKIELLRGAFCTRISRVFAKTSDQRGRLVLLLADHRYSAHRKLTRKGFSSRSVGRPVLPVRIVSIEMAALTAGGARFPGV